MEKKSVTIERYLEQVTDGLEYKGHVKIKETKFDYRLKFSVSIPELDKLPPPQSPDEMRERMQITVRRDGMNVHLATIDEYGFFLQLVLGMAVDFYDSSQTRMNNRGAVGEMLRGESPLARYGASISIGVSGTHVFEFEPKLCELLSTPKFGCVLV